MTWSCLTKLKILDHLSILPCVISFQIKSCQTFLNRFEAFKPPQILSTSTNKICEEACEFFSLIWGKLKRFEKTWSWKHLRYIYGAGCLSEGFILGIADWGQESSLRLKPWKDTIRRASGAALLLTAFGRRMWHGFRSYQVTHRPCGSKTLVLGFIVYGSP